MTEFNNIFNWHARKAWTNWELTAQTYIWQWALPLRISVWYSNNPEPDEMYSKDCAMHATDLAKPDWYGYPDGYLYIDILFLSIGITYDALGVE